MLCNATTLYYPVRDTVLIVPYQKVALDRLQQWLCSNALPSILKALCLRVCMTTRRDRARQVRDAAGK